MLRRYFISDDLDDLESIEKELEQKGIATPQIHVLSEKDAEVELHHLHEVSPVLKSDVVRATEVGAVVGLIGAILVLLVAYFAGWTESAAGWVPFIFLAIVVLGFCTWEGGFIGIQEPNIHFKRFQDILKEGKHVLFIDIDPEQEGIVKKVARKHPKLQNAGTGEATPGFVVKAQIYFKRFVKAMP
ncbi:NAD/FAD-utilizing enzyme [Alkalimonas collagenimarina]|uniref:NAD/FAD-utilizing enzyme n=1 Tax=Alkalimonas collagenimarina TaxID=400390 RepID=A0ABT9GWQ8_9GAMM|nr:NAD/FAD-utilizing enzyme [Alkalimonas collagenimarina]MDP4535485.1 NAD/FAD-utilizing enzyme [Alkalimonas collagenimarina]